MQRLLIPLVLLAIAAAAWVASDRLGNPDLTPAIVENLDQVETPMLSARRMPVSLTEPISDDVLQAELDAIVDRSPDGTCLYVAEGGRTLYAARETLPFTPASLQKIVTGVAALSEFEPSMRFETRAMALSQITENGVLDGNLYLVGAGDPVLMTQSYARSFREQPQIRTDIESLAQQLVQDGLKQITGGVYAVEVLFDDDRYPDDWPERFAEQGQSGPLGALMINDGFTEFPSTWQERSQGAVPVASNDPALHAAVLFDDLLEARNVVINSGSRNVSRSDLARVDEDLELVASISSPTVAEIVKQMMTQSDNTTAELLVKAIGEKTAGSGSTAAGTSAVSAVLAAAGFDRLDPPPADGSGLADLNKLSCKFVVSLLAGAEPGTPLGDSLPVAGEEGTLIDRFEGSPAAGRLHAKTGSLNDVTALAGFAEADEDKVLRFAYIVNLTGGAQVTSTMLDIQTDLGTALVQYPVGPTVEQVQPKGYDGASQVARDLGLTTSEAPADEDEPDVTEPATDAEANTSEAPDSSEQDGESIFDGLTDSGSESDG